MAVEEIQNQYIFWTFNGLLEASMSYVGDVTAVQCDLAVCWLVFERACDFKEEQEHACVHAKSRVFIFTLSDGTRIFVGTSLLTIIFLLYVLPACTILVFTSLSVSL